MVVSVKEVIQHLLSHACQLSTSKAGSNTARGGRCRLVGFPLCAAGRSITTNQQQPAQPPAHTVQGSRGSFSKPEGPKLTVLLCGPASTLGGEDIVCLMLSDQVLFLHQRAPFQLNGFFQKRQLCVYHCVRLCVTNRVLAGEGHNSPQLLQHRSPSPCAVPKETQLPLPGVVECPSQGALYCS